MNTRILSKWIAAAACVGAVGAGIAYAAEVGFKDTPMLPGGKWHVHDSDRPQPRVVTPGTFSTQDTPGTAPSDAVVLFDGKDLSAWHADNKGPAQWTVGNGFFQETPGKGMVHTNHEFGDCQLHVEFCEPNPPSGDSQGRGNSGVFFFDGTYEVQVLDSYNNPTYADGSAGSIYGQFPPLVNASRKPGEWQSYDIIWTAPRFKDGQLVSPAYATILHNGVLVQNHTELIGNTGHRILGKYSPHGEKGSIALQDHGNPVRYRNIWCRELPETDRN